MSLYGLTRGFYAYVSDDGNTYQVALTTDDAAAGGFGSSLPAGSNPVYPRGWKMRIGYGVNGSDRTKVPFNSPTNSNWVTPSTFTKKSVAFVQEGLRGEQRYNKT